MKKLSMILLLVAGTGLALAQGRGGIQNEDLQFIKQWKQEQKAQEIADMLALTSEQVATLRDIKSRVEGVKAEFEPREAELKDTVAAAAADIRANIEATDSLSEADMETLQSFRQDHRQLRQEKRLSMQMATIGLEDVLTDEQKETLKSLRPQRGGGEGQATEGKGKGRGERARKDRGRKGGQRVARLLLSDAFLNSYP